MSKWTEVRDGVVAAFDANDVVEAAKQQIIESLSNEGMSAIEAMADKFVEQVQAHALTQQLVGSAIGRAAEHHVGLVGALVARGLAGGAEKRCR